MLNTIANKIRLHEGVVAIIKNKIKSTKSKYERAFFTGALSTEEKILEDLEQIQEVAEESISSIDYELDNLRGL